MKKFFENVCWKINLFFKCVVMDVKSYMLEKRIEKKRAETEAIKKELQTIMGEVVE